MIHMLVRTPAYTKSVSALPGQTRAWDRIGEPAAVDASVRTCLVRAYLTEARRAFRRWWGGGSTSPVGAASTGCALVTGVVVTLAGALTATVALQPSPGVAPSQAPSTMDKPGTSPGKAKGSTPRTTAPTGVRPTPTEDALPTKFHPFHPGPATTRRARPALSRKRFARKSVEWTAIIRSTNRPHRPVGYPIRPAGRFRPHCGSRRRSMP
jgi:hypothetical protein